MDSAIVFWSRGAAALYGWGGAEALGRKAGELLHTAFPEPRAAVVAKLVRHGWWEGELTHYKRDGAAVTVASRWAVQRDAAGTPVRILTINNDITERKRAEAERRLLTERLSLATAVAKVGVWEWHLASGTLTWDATMCEIYGFGAIGAVPYARWAAAVHAEDLPELEATWQRAIADQGQGAMEYRIVAADGAVRYMRRWRGWCWTSRRR